MMSIYYLPFIWIILFPIFGSSKNNFLEENDGSISSYGWNFLYAFGAFLPVILLASLSQPRSDVVLYLNIYNRLQASYVNILNAILTRESGFGWEIFCNVIKMIFGENEYFFRVILALMHSIPILHLFRKNSEDYLFSLYLFIANGCHLAWMMNGMRQFLAVAIIYGAMPLLLKKKYVPLIVVILVAATIHSSAIIMLPIVFIAQGKAWNKKTLIYIGCAVVMTFLFSRYTNLFDLMLSNTEYAGIMQNAMDMGDDGVNPLRVFINSIPMIIAFWGREFILVEDNPFINLCVNMSVITTGLYLVAMVTSGIMVGRLPIYTSLFNFVLLPYLVSHIFTEYSGRIVKIGMVVFYFLYYLLQYGRY